MESHTSLIYERRQEVWAETAEMCIWGLSILPSLGAYNIELEFEQVRNLVLLGWDDEHNTVGLLL